MKKLSFLFVVLISPFFLISQNINDVFKTVPFDVIPGLSDEDKEMLLVNQDTIAITGTMGEIAKLAHSDTYIKLKTSKIGTTQIKIITTSENESIVAVVRTVCADVCDSDVRFYTSRWEELNKDIFFPNLTLDVFLDIDGINNSSQTNINLPLFFPTSFDFDESSEDIKVKSEIEKTYSDNQSKFIRHYIKTEDIVLKWNGKSFSL